MHASTIRHELGDDGIATLTFDDPGSAVNTMSVACVASMDAVLTTLATERESLRGVVLASAKRTFFAGAELNDLIRVEPGDPTGFGPRLRRIKQQLRALETLGVPVVAALGGSAFGGGLEIALAADYRVAVNDEQLRVGFPEVTLGVLPGAGGVVRSVRMLGIRRALEELLLSGRRLSAQDAFDVGLLDELVDSPAELIGAARRWIAANPTARRPWDQEEFELPGGSIAELEANAVLATLPARLAKRTRSGRNPAPAAILAAAVEGAQVDFETAIEIEGRYFMQLAMGDTAKNMIQSTFFDRQRVRAAARVRRAGHKRFEPRRAVVLGAGMMGAGIAHACAAAGLEVILKDIDADAAARGMAHSEQLVAKGVRAGRIDEGEGRALLARIRPGTDPADAEGAELLIEAVFEDARLKSTVYAEVEPYLAPDALLGSNTSTLPIRDLANGVSQPEDFIGLHFFSPVHRMPLLEVVRGPATSEEAVDRALDLAGLLGKTPIVVNDGRGFFTSRVITVFIDEGMAMVAEGVAPASIERASLQAGYPAPVLQLADELNLNLLYRIREEAKAAGDGWTPHPAEAVVALMLELGRLGRLEGAGFYQYADGRRAGLWEGLADAFGAGAGGPADLDLLAERMLFAEVLEAARAYEEGVIESAAAANVASLLGIGFPDWTGGVLQFIDGYPGAAAGFVARAHELAVAHGKRFRPPSSLVDMAERGGRYSDDAKATGP